MIIETLVPQSEILDDGVTVVYVTAPWCGPCKMYGPQVEVVSADFPDVKFLKTDADAAVTDLQELFKKHNTAFRSVPTTLIFEDGELRDTFTGADANKLRKLVEQFTGL